MGDVLTVYKIEVIKRRRKLVNLAECLGLDYSKFSRIINGYSRIPDNFETKVQAVFRRWDDETAKGRIA